MDRPPIPIFAAGAAQKGRANLGHGGHVLNLYAEVNPHGAKAPLVLIGTPGSQLFVDIGTRPILGMHRFKGKLYAATNQGLYVITGEGQHELVQELVCSGPVIFADNGQVMAFVDGARGWYSDGIEVTEFRASGFYPSDVVVYLDGYFVFVRNGTGQFFITRLFSTEFDPLDFATAESSPDDLVTALADHRELWLFGTESVEVWWNVGAADFPFQRIEGAVIEHGCASPWCAANANNRVLWLSDEGVVYDALGYQPRRISTHAVETDLGKRVIGRARAFTYVEEGHWFYQLTVDDVTWVYDMTTGEWHQRSHVDHERHHASSYARIFNKHLIGDFSTGKIYDWSLDYYDDNCRPIISQATFAPVHKHRERVFHCSLEVDIETGVGLTGIGTCPVLITATTHPDWDNVEFLSAFDGNEGFEEESRHEWNFNGPNVHKDAAGPTLFGKIMSKFIDQSPNAETDMAAEGTSADDGSDPRVVFDLDTEDFVIEGHVHLDDVAYAYAPTLISKYHGSSNRERWVCAVDSDAGAFTGTPNALFWAGYEPGTDNLPNPGDESVLVVGPPVLKGIIQHVAIQRIGDRHTAYTQGNPGTTVVSAWRPSAPGVQAPMGFGQVFSGASWFRHLLGHLGEWRIAFQGFHPESGFAPPTQPYPRTPEETAEQNAVLEVQLIDRGVDPLIMLDWSDDGGRSWSNQRMTPLGKIGKFLTRVIWRRLGQARDRRYRVSISDPVKRQMLATAYLKAE